MSVIIIKTLNVVVERHILNVLTHNMSFLLKTLIIRY